MIENLRKSNKKLFLIGGMAAAIAVPGSIVGVEKFSKVNEPTLEEQSAEMVMSAAKLLCKSATLENEDLLKSSVQTYIEIEDQTDTPGYSPAAVLHKVRYVNNCPDVRNLISEMQDADESLRPVEARIQLP